MCVRVLQSSIKGGGVTFILLLCCLRIANLLVLAHVLTECVLVVGQEVALAANALVVHLVDVGSEAFRARCLVVAQNAEVGFDVGVEVTL